MRKTAATIAALSLLLALAATPASAAPPETVDEPFFFIFPDVENGFIVFWNITRDDFCDWEASEFEGDPPVTHLVSVTYNETPKGPVVFRFSDTSHLELWTIDADADLSGPCQDTDASFEPWASGGGRASQNDNDLDHDASVAAGLHRTNSFGHRGQGTVRDASGDAWHYSWVSRAQRDSTGESRTLVERAELRQR
jgi:hypothetical protein